MMAAKLEHPRFRIDWLCVQRVFYYALAFMAVFAAGGWLTSIRVQESTLPYKNRATAHYEDVQRVAGPNPVATIKCLRHRGDVGEAVADQAVAVSNFSAVPDQLLEAIPDCPAAPKPAAPGAKAH